MPLHPERTEFERIMALEAYTTQMGQAIGKLQQQVAGLIEASERARLAPNPNQQTR